MPWKAFQDGDKYCVHKVGADGSKGEQVACHASLDQANAQVRALYANAKEALPPELAEAMTTSEMPQNLQPQAVHHEHTHAHGTLNHSHPHEHDKEHGLDGQMGKHDHPHEDQEPPEEEKGESPEDEKAEDQPVQPPPQKPTEKKEALRTLVVGETVNLKEAVVDAEHKTVEVTLIQPGWSKMGRYYSKETLGKAVNVFEGTKAYADHPRLDDEKNRPERSVVDITGYYTNVRQADDGSLKAVRHFVGKKGDEVWPLVLETVTQKPDLIGLSINALGKTKVGEAEGRSGVIVEELVHSISVDDVTTASAGGKYDRLLQAGEEFTAALLRSLSYDEWRSANPDFEARIKKEMRTARKEELDAAAVKEAAALKASVTERDTTIGSLQETIQGLEQKLTDQARESEHRVNELLADLKLAQSKLPAEWCQAARAHLLTVPPAEMDTFIEAEKQRFFALKEKVVVSHAGVARDAELTDPKLTTVLEALGTDPSIYPREGESPEQYAARKRKMRK